MSEPTESRTARFLLALSYLGFVSLGLPDDPVHITASVREQAIAELARKLDAPCELRV